MNNNTKKIISGVALAVIGVSAFFGVTHSKYTNTITGNGETQIAKWNFKVNSETEQMETIKLADTYDQSTLINDRIAPRNKWKFRFSN